MLLRIDEVYAISKDARHSAVLSLECWVQDCVLALVRRGALRLLDKSPCVVDALPLCSGLVVELRMTRPRSATGEIDQLAVCTVWRRSKDGGREDLYTTSTVPVLMRPWGIASSIALWLRSQGVE